MFTKMNFITETSVRVLKLLAGDPMREFYQREVAREAGVSIGAANQILRVLAGKEIATHEKRGRMFFYRYNLQNPVARYFKIFLNINELDELVRQLRRRCKRVVLFESKADGSDVKDSDFDLLVLTEEKEKTRSIINRYKSKIGGKISPIIVNAVEFVELRSKDKPLYTRILGGSHFGRQSEPTDPKAPRGKKARENQAG
jgi:predicted nucleotidyltransferase